MATLKRDRSGDWILRYWIARLGRGKHRLRHRQGAFFPLAALFLAPLI
jgi:hypothetical protein